MELFWLWLHNIQTRSNSAKKTLLAISLGDTYFSIELNPYKYIIGFGLKNEFSCFVNGKLPHCKTFK